MTSLEWYDAREDRDARRPRLVPELGPGENPGAGPRDLVRPNVVSNTYTFGGLINSTLRRRARRPARGFRPRSTATSSCRTERRGRSSNWRLVARPGGTGTQNDQTNGGSGVGSARRSRRLARSRRERGSFFAHYDFDLSDSTNLYAQVLVGNNEVNSVGTLPLGIAGWAGTIYSGNPFLPANIQQLMTANNIPSFVARALSHDRRSRARPIHHRQRHAVADVRRRTREISSGGFFEGWRLGGYAQLGTNDNQITQVDFIRTDRLPEAMDAVQHPANGRDRLPRRAVRSRELRQLRADQPVRPGPRIGRRRSTTC